MKIGISGPISILELSEYLYDKNLPIGLESPVLTNIVKEYLKMGHEVVVFTLDKSIKKAMVFYGENITVCVGIYRKKSWNRAKDFFLLEMIHLYRFMKKYKVDVMNANWTYEFAIPAIKIYGQNTVVSVRDNSKEVYDTLKNYYRYIRLKMNNYVLKKECSYIATSPYISKALLNMYNIDANIIPDAISSNIIFNDEKILNKKHPRIICVNNGFTELKNVKTSVKIFSILKQKIEGLELVLIGQGYGKEEECYRWCKENNLDKGIKFIGSIPHGKAIEYIKNSDLLLHLSREESFGGVVLEALSQGTPVIGGESSGAIPWLLNYGKIGMIVNIDDEVQIVNLILKLFNDEGLWKNYSKKSIKYVTENFLVRNIADSYINEFDKILIPEKNR